jgi:DNA polymerase III psi subunit
VSVTGLLNHICKVLPPHHRLDANDPPTIELPILLFGEREQPLTASTLVSAPNLVQLRADARAKRALWRDLKPLLRLTRNV